jgi:hypothetical protein
VAIQTALAGEFHVDRDVFEFFAALGFNLTFHIDDLIAGRVVLHHHMKGEDVVLAVDRPGVGMMGRDHFRQRGQAALNTAKKNV